MLRLFIRNIVEAVLALISSIVDVLFVIFQPLVFPWAAAYIGCLYVEIVDFYFKECKKNNLPFVEPDTLSVARTASQFKRLKNKNIIKNSMKISNKFLMLKLIVVPFNVSSLNRERLVNILNSGVEYNKSFDMDNITLLTKSLKCYKSLFEISLKD